MNWNSATTSGRFDDSRCSKQTGCRTLNAGIVSCMAEDATLIIGANVPMHNSREGGNGEYWPPPSTGQYRCQRPRSCITDRHHTPMASADTMLLYSRRRFSMKVAQCFMGIAVRRFC